MCFTTESKRWCSLAKANQRKMATKNHALSPPPAVHSPSPAAYSSVGETEDCEVSAALDNLSLYFPDEMKGVSEAVRSGKGIMKVPWQESSSHKTHEVDWVRRSRSGGQASAHSSPSETATGNTTPPYSVKISPRRSSVSKNSVAIRKSRTASFSSVHSRRSRSSSPSRTLSYRQSIRGRSSSYHQGGSIYISMSFGHCTKLMSTHRHLRKRKAINKYPMTSQQPLNANISKCVLFFF